MWIKLQWCQYLENPPLLERNLRDLMEVFMSKGNSFEEDNQYLVTLDNQVRESAAAALSLGYK